MSKMTLTPNRFFGGTSLSANEARIVNEYIEILEETNEIQAETINYLQQIVEALDKKLEIKNGNG